MSLYYAHSLEYCSQTHDLHCTRTVLLMRTRSSSLPCQLRVDCAHLPTVANTVLHTHPSVHSIHHFVIPVDSRHFVSGMRIRQCDRCTPYDSQVYHNPWHYYSLQPTAPLLAILLVCRNDHSNRLLSCI